MPSQHPRLNELRALPDPEIRAQLDTLRQELWDHRVKTKDGSQPKTHEVSAIKRQIARIHTVLNERRPQEASTPS